MKYISKRVNSAMIDRESMGENVLYGCGRLTTINTTETIYRKYLSELNYLPDVEINY